MDALMQFLQARWDDALLGLTILAPGVFIGAGLAYLTSSRGAHPVAPGMQPFRLGAWCDRLLRRIGR